MVEKKIVLCFRQGNKVGSKNLYLNKDMSLAKKISRKEEEEKVRESIVSWLKMSRKAGRRRWRRRRRGRWKRRSAD